MNLELNRKAELERIRLPERKCGYRREDGQGQTIRTSWHFVIIQRKKSWQRRLKC